MTTPNHVRDHVYGIVAHPTMSAEQKADMLKRVSDATTAIQRPTPQYPAPTMAMAPTPAPVAPPPTAAFSTAPAPPPLAAGTPLAGPAATASFAPMPSATPADEIDRQQALALAALAKPTAYPSPKAPTL